MRFTCEDESDPRERRRSSLCGWDPNSGDVGLSDIAKNDTLVIGDRTCKTIEKAEKVKQYEEV